jgi:hypothetical protein
VVCVIYFVKIFIKENRQTSRERQNEEKRRRRFEDKTLRLFIASYLKDNMFESGEGVPYEVTTDVLYDAWVERTGIRYK